MIGAGITLAVLVLVFVGLLPQFASYSGAWTHLTTLSWGWWIAISAAGVLTQISGVWSYQAALPGLRFRDGFVQIETATAISSTVPAGSAVAVGMTYRMLSSFGFSDVAISSAVVTTGIWNFAVKLGLPLVAIALLVTSTHATRAMVEASTAGMIVLIALAVSLWLAFHTSTSAHLLGHLADRVVNWGRHLRHRPPTDRLERALLHFERQTVHVLRTRARQLTGAALASQAAAFALVLVVARSVGISSSKVTVAAILTAFAVARLAGAIPITPGGLGTLDAAFISVLTAFGSTSSQALATDLVWRLMTYFIPIFPGIVTYLIWIRWQSRAGTRPKRDAALPRRAARGSPAS